ncbi:MAG: hypothetical protein ACRDJN_15765, partial [Chloroflexota bacterium]
EKGTDMELDKDGEMTEQQTKPTDPAAAVRQDRQDSRSERRLTHPGGTCAVCGKPTDKRSRWCRQHASARQQRPHFQDRGQQRAHALAKHRQDAENRRLADLARKAGLG